jgi:hypothetical protein
VKKSSDNKGEITLSQLTEILSDVKKEMQSKFKEMQDTFDEDAFAAMAQAVDQIVAEKHGASNAPNQGHTKPNHSVAAFLSLSS